MCIRDSAGTVYTILYKMENDGLIEVTRTFERRKLYKITPVGEMCIRDRLQTVRLYPFGGGRTVFFIGIMHPCASQG